MLTGANLVADALGLSAFGVRDVLPACITPVVLLAVMWPQFKRMPSAVFADAEGIRVGTWRGVVVTFGWDELREVRVERRMLGHRIVAVPRDAERVRCGRLKSYQAFATGWSSDAIIRALAELAGERCHIR